MEPTQKATIFAYFFPRKYYEKEKKIVQEKGVRSKARGRVDSNFCRNKKKKRTKTKTELSASLELTKNMSGSRIRSPGCIPFTSVPLVHILGL